MSTPSVLMVIVAVVFVVFGGIAVATQDKYAVQVPGGLGLSDCRGYEDWTQVAASFPKGQINVIVANPSMIEAYRAGFPGNGTQVPDGSKIMKIAWKSKQSTEAPFPVDVPDNLLGLGCMVKDRKRFPTVAGGDGALLGMTPRPTRSRPPPWLTTRRRETTPSVGSRAIR